MSRPLIHNGLDYWSRNNPDRLAIVVGEEKVSLTYRELADWSDAIAWQLQQSGVVAGDRVGVTGEISLEWIATAFGVWKAGAILNPYNIAYRDDELRALVERSAPRLIVADATQAGRIDYAPVMTFAAVEGCRHSAKRPEAVEVSGDAPALIVYTSGSTGLPKGVVISHRRQLTKMMEVMSVEPALRAGARILTPLPIHTFSGVWNISFATTIGATAYFSPDFDPARALRMLTQYRITVFLSISMMFDRVARVPGFAEADLSSLELVQGGGMRLARGTFEAWLAKGQVVRQVYGLTEIGGTGLMASREEAIANPGSCGRGMPFSTVRILRDDGSDAAPGEAGHVLLSTASMMLGYWGEPDNVPFEGDWMTTGDIGIVDADGFFTFMDRRKDVMDRPEGMIPPSEVEIAIAQLDPVIEVAVASTETIDGRPGHCAWIYAADGLDAETVRKHCQAVLAGYKVPTHLMIGTQPLPRMMSGKIDRHQLLRDHAPSLA